MIVKFRWVGVHSPLGAMLACNYSNVADQKSNAQHEPDVDYAKPTSAIGKSRRYAKVSPCRVVVEAIRSAW
ncbi:hypothetical protein IHE33_14920 (plasmid) [Mycetohabitans endofungorum]